MKSLVEKALVATNLLLIVVFFVTMFGRDIRHQFGASTDALSGDGERFAKMMPARDEGRMGGRYDAPAAASPPMEERKADSRKKMATKAGLMAVLGSSAEGSGDNQLFGAGSAPGIGSLGARGTGGMGVGRGVSGAAEGVDLEGEGASGVSSEPARTRAWFPETFLFEPRLVTDANGSASLDVKVPDRLTSWRILALAHSREGAQAGTVATFLGTLPTYVDPVVPPFLRAGDSVRLPVQVVNTTAAPLARALTVEAVGGRLTGGSASVKVAGGATGVAYVTLTADQPGSVTLKAALAGGDAVVREIPVLPTGQPVSERRTGTLAAPRELSLELPADLDPKTTRARLVVYPGALALLRSELASANQRGGVAEDAYALRLAGEAPKLLAALGDASDPEALRTSALLATQRVLRDSRHADLAQSAMLAEAALAHPSSPVLSRLAQRLAGQLASQQRPDGTCGGGNGWTLQHVLAATAECVRAVSAAAVDDAGRQRAQVASLKASGAVERQLALVQDGYTAAALVASGAAQGTVLEKLRAKVREAVQAHGDGTRSLVIDGGAVRADGTTPTAAEADALAILALDPKADAAMRADLGANLLAAYAPSSGWGDGRTNLVALRAVVALFREPVPASVRVTLELDGKVLGNGSLAAQAKDVLSLDVPVPDAHGRHAWRVRAEPPVPGLGFSLEVDGYRPWRAEPMQGGLELSVKAPKEAKVGLATDVLLEAAAPAGMALTLRHALPAGMQADRPSLEKLVDAGTITSFTLEDGEVKLELSAREPGQIFSATYRVVPTLAGTLHASASTLQVAGRPELVHHVLPAAWTVK